MTAARVEPEPSRGMGRFAAAITLFTVCLLPASAALLVGLSRVWWNLADPIQQAYMTAPRVFLLVFVLVAVLVPFVFTAVGFWNTRRGGGSWLQALRRNSVTAVLLGVGACSVVMLTGGGF